MNTNVFVVFLTALALSGCAQFNKVLFPSDRILIASSGSNRVLVYGVSSSGTLTQQSNITIVSPSLVAAHPSSGAFLVYTNNASIACYKYDYRSGTGPTALSSTAVTGITYLRISPDGNSVLYVRTSDSKIYWRSITDCTLGDENSATAPGIVAANILMPDDSSFVLLTAELGFNGIWRYSRNLTTGALTLTDSSTTTMGANKTVLTPNGKYLVFFDSAGLSSANASTLATITAFGALNTHLLLCVSNTQVIRLRPGITHTGITLSSSGTLSVGGNTNYGITDFFGGTAISPSRALFFTGDQATGSIWTHTVSSSAPFSSAPVQTVLGVTPSAIAYLTGYEGV